MRLAFNNENNNEYFSNINNWLIGLVVRNIKGDIFFIYVCVCVVVVIKNKEKRKSIRRKEKKRKKQKKEKEEEEKGRKENEPWQSLSSPSFVSYSSSSTVSP